MRSFVIFDTTNLSKKIEKATWKNVSNYIFLHWKNVKIRVFYIGKMYSYAVQKT